MTATVPAVLTTESTPEAPSKSANKEHPWWAVPTVLGIVLLSSGGFVLLLAQALKILSSIG
ncbi:hypothetical protein [Demequina mangrovi]|uniref:Uncharacterized protein n=1 Tax=Demequina mangrovi TaxID=1043493 RepID=A0A1H6UTV8_9MICO|nr:hypothetical protein [Demequina mangrovi]SEI95779.1 hypothetical protein SAMN05421637_0544 [Demequina mangrovi]